MRAAVAVAPSQFVHQLRQIRRQLRSSGKVALQPFPDGIANRPARLVVDELKTAVDSAIHDEFHVA